MTRFIHIHVSNGLREELALERHAALEFEREADEAWQAGAYTWSGLMRERAAEARARVAQLEGEQ
jgi:hypothetical protein